MLSLLLLRNNVLTDETFNIRFRFVVRFGKILEGEKNECCNVKIRFETSNSYVVLFAPLLLDLDATAGNIAFSHCVKGGSWPAPLIVTAGIDSIQLNPTLRPSIKTDHILTGQISWVGSSSMEISMSVWGEEEGEPWLLAKFTFVAREGESGGATKIVELMPETDEERVAFRIGEG